jgi:DNA-binding transcriptional ArsR family regulator
MVTHGHVSDVDVTLAALADPTRRQVVELLRERPRRPGELAKSVATSGPAMSKHLRVLRASGLVEVEAEIFGAERDARLRVYRLRPEPFIALHVWLDQVQAFWAGQLDAFKEYAERTRNAQSAEKEEQQ